MIRCPTCNREWPDDSEYGICVEMLGECIWCHFHPGGEGDDDEAMAIKVEYAKRRHVWVWVPVPNPRE
jgi:hypothetical protein